MGLSPSGDVVILAHRFHLQENYKSTRAKTLVDKG
jgi:hypothetical protein